MGVAACGTGEINRALEDTFRGVYLTLFDPTYDDYNIGLDEIKYAV